MRASRPLFAVFAGALTLTAACGGDDGAGGATPGGTDVRTVRIDMVDIGFEPAALEVAQGETIRFVFTNTGAITHDAFIGDPAEQTEHAKQMRGVDGSHHGAHGDDEEQAITVDPGDTGDLTYTFDEAGTFQIGCHQPGHYAAGMKIDVAVT